MMKKTGLCEDLSRDSALESDWSRRKIRGLSLFLMSLVISLKVSEKNIKNIKNSDAIETYVMSICLT